MKKKRGLSTIVSTLLILLLVFVAIGIVWVVVRNVIQEGSEQISLGKYTLSLDIERVEILENNNFSIGIRRNAGPGEFVGVHVIASDGKNSETFVVEESLQEHQRKFYTFELEELDISDLEKIDIAPVFRLESGREVVGDVGDTWVKGSGSSTNLAFCPEGAQCGSDGADGTCGSGCSGAGQVCDGSTYECVDQSQCTQANSCDGLNYECSSACGGEICGDYNGGCPSVPNAQTTQCGTGTCEIVSCSSGYTDADGDYSNGCEEEITECNDGDQSCPSGCYDETDSDCQIECLSDGTGCLTGETCNQNGNCVEEGTNAVKIIDVDAFDDDGNVPENTLDRDSSTRWSSDVDGTWIEFELSDSAMVEEVQIEFYNGHKRKTSFSIEVSSDGDNWNEVYDGQSDGSSSGYEVFTFNEASNVNYVKIVGYGNDGGGNSQKKWTSINEVKIENFGVELVDASGDCKDGEVRDCGTNVGVCSTGTETCSNGQWGSCVGGNSGTTESSSNGNCEDGLDNDCDGFVDGADSGCFVSASYEKPRVIITSDFGADADDQQSLVRALLYSNDIDIEGIVGSTSIVQDHDPDNRLHLAHDIIDAYDQVDENLRVHDPDYPTANYLRGITVPGLDYQGGGNNPHFEYMVGDGKSSEGSELIVDAIEKDDDRPIWLLAWGGTSTIAQAIWDIDDRYSNAQRDELLSKVRIHEILGQDNTGNWIAHNYPDILFIRSKTLYSAVGVCDGDPTDPDLDWCGGSKIGDDSWVDSHIQSKGALGSAYPDRAYNFEGDSPSFLYLIPNGLSNPEYPWYGSWGGRFSRNEVENVPWWIGSNQDNTEFSDYFVHTEVSPHDSWFYEGQENNRIQTSMIRWKEPFWYDFVARLEWSMTSNYGSANHEPVPVVDGDSSRDIIYRSVSSGQSVSLDASGSSDPDGDSLSFKWYEYPEVSTGSESLSISGSSSSQASATIPGSASSGDEYHLILEVSDDDSPPTKLTRYRRIVFEVN